MKPSSVIARTLRTALLLAACAASGVQAQTPAAAPPAPAGAVPASADPWPRDVSIPDAAALLYQPQINTWVDNQIDFRAAVALKPAGATNETFGVVFATARTQIDKVARMVVFENLQLTKVDFPPCPAVAPVMPRRCRRAWRRQRTASRSTGCRPRSRPPASSRRRSR